jgi:hypothetical protein
MNVAVDNNDFRLMMHHLREVTALTGPGVMPRLVLAPWQPMVQVEWEF